ncbi:hypothetical protein CAC42_5723 [Sphaceloma murrayae]|uniref:Uncharacterized protein n=1 Tax=Sphaceloma murrayae TaxID=2082308 RepID=A0A2K1QZC5_9PEZI|nr:hypothetical protein CAC42_5723 [Sphaceloma murrayae]
MAYHSSYSTDHYHNVSSQAPTPPGNDVAHDRGRSSSGIVRPVVVHDERDSSTSIGQRSFGNIYAQKRPSQGSDEYDRSSTSARTSQSTQAPRKTLPPTPPRSSPSSPSPSRSQRTSPRTQTTVPAYERCFTPPLDTNKKALPLPGTMSSSQSKQNSPVKTRNRSRQGRRRAPPSRPASNKVGNFFKSMFTKRNIDHDSFERIEDRHWTE